MTDDHAGTRASIYEAISAMHDGTTPEPDSVIVHPDIASAPAPSGPSAGDLAALGDYVRLLADRMGLGGWTFEVPGAPAHRGPGIASVDARPDVARAALFVSRTFFDESPGSRRLALVAELIGIHLEPARAGARAAGGVPREFFADLDAGVARAAAAWAPALPLPLVGLMKPRRAAR